jgi:methylmalonyl-CoA mutase cobalamin-binding domain/chain
MTDLSAPFKTLAAYRPVHKVRFVTAASLFDGHDAAINIMRRLLMSMGAEVIHLGHNRSVDEVVTAALQEDVQGIAVSSYQGGHNEYFTYMVELLKARGGEHIQVFGGGGGVIVPAEIQMLAAHGVPMAPSLLMTKAGDAADVVSALYVPRSPEHLTARRTRSAARARNRIPPAAGLAGNIA